MTRGSASDLEDAMSVRPSARANLSAEEARRLALDALGFRVKRPPRTGAAHVRATLNRLGAVQIDSVNVLARAHYLPTFSRYGPYRAEAFDRVMHDRSTSFEYWGHAACVLPIDLYPDFRWRMNGQIQRWAALPKAQRQFIESVYREVAERGPVSARELSNPGKRKVPWWGWSDGKLAVEVLYTQGRLAIAGRRNFERLYDVAERVFPRSVLDMPAVPDGAAKKNLIVRAATAMGVGTAKHIARYFEIDGWWDRASLNGRRAPAKTHMLFDELVEDRRLEQVRVEGWKEPAYMVPDCHIPTSVDVRAIVSPFDPILWERAWTKSVFGFEYQIEIYVPAPKRVYGYYVLPFLMGDNFAGRVDLKADRKASKLLVAAAHVEERQKPAVVADALADEIRAIANWLALESIAVAQKGTLSRALKIALS